MHSLVEPTPDVLPLLRSATETQASVTHTHWRSTKECVSHVLWMLCFQQPDDVRAEHACAINRAFTSPLCSCCTSLLLSYARISSWMILFAEQLLDGPTDHNYRQVLRKVLESFFFYPLGIDMVGEAVAIGPPPIAIPGKTGHSRCFDLLCWAAICADDRDETLANALYCSMKHWTDRNFAVFCYTFIDDLHHKRKRARDTDQMRARSKSGNRQKADSAWTTMTLIALTVERRMVLTLLEKENSCGSKITISQMLRMKSRAKIMFLARAKKYNWHLLCENKSLKDEAARQLDRSIEQSSKKKLRCSWYLCSRIIIGSRRQTCGQCRMVWYCSRSCQKRSWKAMHRLACGKLFTMYSDIVLN